MKEYKIFNVDRKIISIQNHLFLVDIAFIGNDSFLCRAEDIDKGTKTEWTEIKDDNPVHAYAEYLDLIIDL